MICVIFVDVVEHLVCCDSFAEGRREKNADSVFLRSTEFKLFTGQLSVFMVTVTAAL